MVGYNLRPRQRNGLVSKQEDPPVLESNNTPAKPSKESKPTMGELNRKVQTIIAKSSWWDRYGVDWCIILLSVCALLPIAVLLLRSDDWGPFLIGLALLGLIHSMIKTKISHLAAHGALCKSKGWNTIWQYLFIEFFGSFSAVSSMDIHLKVHHPYTNIVGLGDSAIWRVPFLPCFTYMFVAPLLLPPLTPVVAMGNLIVDKKFVAAVKCLIVVTCGLVANVWFIMWAGAMTCTKAIICILVYRAPMEIPYIHVNIFQHIGLPMYSRENHPPRLQLMCNGALNLTRAPIINWFFGHSLVDCHVEHHLFPTLSDNMCAKVKPVVKEYILGHGLAYQEEDYWDRLKLFVKKYKELMVNAPPITEFIGIQ
ncbi:fatty acid desaturase 6-like [Amphiura filiformis]|uniref:fatty acid desaturase 6-like n=1 Tax=Amphiura filiformis TaxID=82378 RepID=UPI003B20DE13